MFSPSPHAHLSKLSLLALLALAGALFVGCFDSHGGGGGDPDGGGRIWTDCFSALSGGATGDRCDFAGSCDDGMEPCGPGGSFAMCVEGELMIGSRFCTLAEWTSCGEYLAAGGREGDACRAGDFEGCTRPDPEGCCWTQIECSGGIILESPVCPRECPPDLCPSYEPPPPEAPLCRAQSECADTESCVPPGVPRACGACMPEMRTCASDADCPTDAICLEVPHPCDCDLPSTYCIPRCAADSDCASDERCDASTGRCDAISCADGHACGENTRCSPGAAFSDAHGCARLSCTVAADCDCGACIDGLCYDGPGTCELPVP